MKLSKVGKNRIGVKKADTGYGRGVLYVVPSETGYGSAAEDRWVDIVKERVNKANNLYSAFFRAESLIVLENHFRQIVREVSNATNPAAAQKILKEYKGYEDTKRGFQKLAFFSYQPSGKNIFHVIRTHIRERMISLWANTEEYEDAATAVLVCLCEGSNYKTKMEGLITENSYMISNFWLACRESHKKPNKGPYVPVKTEELETVFTEILRALAKGCNYNAYIRQDEAAIEADLEKQKNWLKKLTKVYSKQKGNRVEILLKNVTYSYATDIRIDAVLVRMRKSLKRGSNAEIARELLQGLAQMEGKNLKKVIEDYEKDNKIGELKKFIKAVNMDYHKFNIVRSVRNINVKIQPKHQDGQDTVLAITGVSGPKRKGLEETLVRYTSSKEESDRVLIDMKRILFDYFLPEETDIKAAYTKKERLWALPKNNLGYFGCTSYEEWDEEISLEQMFNSGQRVSAKIVKEKLNKYNYVKYLKLLKKAETDFEQYWLSYIKEYIEKRYVKEEKKNKKKWIYESDQHIYFVETMIAECWKQMVRFLCGKFIDIGKAVYHFAMPEDCTPKNGTRYGILREEYKNGLSSFDYEKIKAEENYQRDISVATVAALNNLARAVIDSTKHEDLMTSEKNKEDIAFLNEKELKVLLKTDAVKQILRFYGGASTFSDMEQWDENAFIQELLSHVKSIRNESFHYTEGKKANLKVEYVKKLWEKEIQFYGEQIIKKYYSNNVTLFYTADSLKQLIEKLYGNTLTAEAQIPAFRSIWKRKDLPSYMNKLNGVRKLNEDTKTIFGNALYFLLKEIYYKDFIVNEKEAAKLFFQAVKKNENQTKAAVEKNRTAETKQLYNAASNFSAYVKALEAQYEKEGFTFGNVCQMIQTEYAQQNAYQTDEEIYQHFKMLLPKCLKEAFITYVEKNYDFIMKPVCNEPANKDINGCLHNVNISCSANSLLTGSNEDERIYSWFTFAHLIHPKQLNHLIGDMKAYIQYRESIWRRAAYAGEYCDKAEKNREKVLLDQKTKEVKRIVEILDFVKESVGQVSNNFHDYYESEEDYAGYLLQYVDFSKAQGDTLFHKLKNFCKKGLGDGQKIDIYADDENPKVLRHVEHARMYAGGDSVLSGYKKVTLGEIKSYYKNQEEAVALQLKPLCGTEEEQQKVVNQQRRRNRITLNEVTDIHSIVNDMLGQLVSLSYLRERDEMYLLFGFYYMVLCNKENNWRDPFTESVNTTKYNVENGLVLYQILGVFDYGTKLLHYNNKENKWEERGGQISGKISIFAGQYKESWECALRLFQDDNIEGEIIELRNYVDHSKYYAKHDKSIVDLYNGYYTKFFGYSSKLRKSVLFIFRSVLGRAFLDVEVMFEKHTDLAKFKMNALKGTTFTYKLANKKTVNLKARSDSYEKLVKSVLEYSAAK